MNALSASVSAREKAESSAISISHLPRRCCLASLAWMSGRVVAEPFSGEDGADLALGLALRAFEHQHVVDLAAGFVDTRHHRDQEHRPDGAEIFAVAGRAEITRQPAVEARRPVPLETVEPSPDRMEGKLARPLVGRLVRDVAADAREAVVLHILAQIADIGVAQRPRERVAAAGRPAVRRWRER